MRKLDKVRYELIARKKKIQEKFSRSKTWREDINEIREIDEKLKTLSKLFPEVILPEGDEW